MLRVVTVVGSLLALGACGGGGKPPSNEPVASKEWQDGPPPADAAPAEDAPLTMAECQQLFEHVVELMRAGMPPDEWAAGKEDLEQGRDEMITGCFAEKRVSRVQYRCMLAASALEQLKDCVPQE